MQAAKRPSASAAFQSVQDAAKGVLFDLGGDEGDWGDSDGLRSGQHPGGLLSAAAPPLPRPEYRLEEVPPDPALGSPAYLKVHVVLPMIGGAAEADVDMGPTALKVRPSLDFSGV